MEARKRVCALWCTYSGEEAEKLHGLPKYRTKYAYYCSVYVCMCIRIQV